MFKEPKSPWLRVCSAFSSLNEYVGTVGFCHAWFKLQVSEAAEQPHGMLKPSTVYCWHAELFLMNTILSPTVLTDSCCANSATLILSVHGALSQRDYASSVGIFANSSHDFFALCKVVPSRLLQVSLKLLKCLASCCCHSSHRLLPFEWFPYFHIQEGS